MSTDQVESAISSEDAGAVAVEAYVFGYPLVLMDVTCRTMTAVSRPEGTHAPVNQFAHLRAFPDADFTDVVSPNADTLYSSTVFDLSEEPIVLSVPDSDGRYYLMPMLDAYTNVFGSPGSRTSGTGPGDFAVVGPFWQGELPEGMERIDSPTNLAWMIGRTQTDGKADYENVHQFQDGLRLTPLSAWGTEYTPPEVPVKGKIDTTPPVDQVAAMDAQTFFNRVAELMVDNPPSAADADALARFAAIGLAPGKPFDLSNLDPEHAAAVRQAPKQGLDALAKAFATPRPETQVNGWTYFTGLGRYGTDYGLRALVAVFGLGANTAEDAVYPNARVDANGEPLHGEHNCRMHFEPGQTPPVNAFWSVTMYNERQFFVDNPIDRYAIGDRDALEPNPDGSLDLLIQHESPENQANWLPAPEGSFNLIMRMYWPKEEALNNSWQPPSIERVK